MAARRDSDLNSDDVYRSLYGNDRKLKPERIQSYAVYNKQLIDSTRTLDNFVVAVNDTNEISVSFSGRSDCRIFTFDEVICSDKARVELYDSLFKSAMQDIIIGVNVYIFVCDLALSRISRPFESNISYLNMDDLNTLAINLLKELLLFTKNSDKDSSLHVSHFEIHDDKVIDLLNECHDCKDMKVFKVPKKNCTEIKDLTEIPITEEKDIMKLFTKPAHDTECYANCCHSLLCVSLISKGINREGFEYIKVGKLNVVHFARCKIGVLGGRNENSYGCLLEISKTREFPDSPKSKVHNILRPAFGRNSKTSIIVLLSSKLYSPENDLKILQFISETRKTLNHPEIDLKLIIPDSLKEYAEEVKELEKISNAISKKTGTMLNSLSYRSFKNLVSVENEKVKTLKDHFLSITENVEAKKKHLLNLQGKIKTREDVCKETETPSELVKLDLQKCKEKNKTTERKISSKADKIVSMKQIKVANELYKKKFKSEINKSTQEYEEMNKNFHCMMGELNSLLCDIDAHQTSLKSTLELLMVDMKNTLSGMQTLQEDLTRKLNNLCNIDTLVNTWKQSTENLLFKLLSFIGQHDRNFYTIKMEISSSIAHLQKSESEILEIIRKFRNEKCSVLSYHFGKVQLFCDSSFKILSEIMHMLNAVQSSYKAEVKAIGASFHSSCLTLQKLISDISTTMEPFQQNYEERKKELSQMTEMIYFHHKFKKKFDEKMDEIKTSLQSLKQSCLGHNDASNNKWSEVHKSSQTAVQKNDMSVNLSVIHREISKYLDSLSLQKINVEYSLLKDKVDIIDNQTHQLMQIQEEIRMDVGKASEANKKENDKELLQMKDCMNFRKAEMENYFSACSSKLENCSKSFLDELRSVQQSFSNHREELNKDLDLLLSSISSLNDTFNGYKLGCSSILEKSERSFKVMPPVAEYKNDNIRNVGHLSFDDSKLLTSTPNIHENQKFNTLYEKEKLLSRIQSVAEEQLSQKLNTCDVDTEIRRDKKCNISTMSLPNLNNYSKMPSKIKSISKLKLSKK